MKRRGGGDRRRARIARAEAALAASALADDSQFVTPTALRRRAMELLRNVRAGQRYVVRRGDTAVAVLIGFQDYAHLLDLEIRVCLLETRLGLAAPVPEGDPLARLDALLDALEEDPRPGTGDEPDGPD